MSEKKRKKEIAAEKAAAKRKKEKEENQKDAEKVKAGEEDPHKKRKGLTRTRGTFSEKDPPVLSNGHEFPAEFQVPSIAKFQPFIEHVVNDRPCILKLKKGQVKKVMTMQISTMSFEGDGLKEATQFANSTAKTFGATQASMGSVLKKATTAIRKSSTVEEKSKETAMFLGFDFLLNGMTRPTDAASTSTPLAVPDGAWVADRDRLVELLVQLLGLNL